MSHNKLFALWTLPSTLRPQTDRWYWFQRYPPTSEWRARSRDETLPSQCNGFAVSSDDLFHKHFGVCLPVCVRMTMFSGKAWLAATPIADLEQHGEHSAARPENFSLWRYCLLYSWWAQLYWPDCASAGTTNRSPTGPQRRSVQVMLKLHEYSQPSPSFLPLAPLLPLSSTLKVLSLYAQCMCLDSVPIW